MKKLTLIIAAFLVIQASYSQDWVEFTASETTETDCNVLTSADTIVEFEIIFPGIFSTVIDTFNRVQIKNHCRMDSVGFPEVPIISYLVAIPDCDNVLVNIELLDSVKISNFYVYPAPELVPDTTLGGGIALMEEFAYNRSFYESDTWFPAKIIEAVDKGAIRAQDVVRVLFYPIRFNPVKKELWAYSKAKVSLTFLNASGSIQNNVGIFNEVIGNTVINYNSNGLNASINCGAGMVNLGNWYYVDDVSSQKIDSACDYVIITHDSLYFKDSGKAAIDSLAAHRAAFNGFDVAIITTQTIKDDILPAYLDEYEKILKLIDNTYNYHNANHTFDGKLAYVNLFGDAFFDDSTDCVPTHLEGYDVYFTQLTYDSIAGEYDPYPDIMIGRCSVDTVTQVQNVVHKILNFESIC